MNVKILFGLVFVYFLLGIIGRLQMDKYSRKKYLRIAVVFKMVIFLQVFFVILNDQLKSLVAIMRTSDLSNAAPVEAMVFIAIVLAGMDIIDSCFELTDTTTSN